jgi:hypothetical protein
MSGLDRSRACGVEALRLATSTWAAERCPLRSSDGDRRRGISRAGRLYPRPARCRVHPPTHRRCVRGSCGDADRQADQDRPALVGLFLHVEHGLTGRQVQRVHRILAAQRPPWPRFALPDDRGPITIHDVIAEPPGERRDRAIESLATSTWNACRGLRGSIQAFLSLCGVTPPVT